MRNSAIDCWQDNGMAAQIVRIQYVAVGHCLEDNRWLSGEWAEFLSIMHSLRLRSHYRAKRLNSKNFSHVKFTEF
jgi:hypothetical protein